MHTGDNAPRMCWGSFSSAAVALLLAVAALETEFLDDDSLTIVDVDEDRLKVLARGARCVSLSSAIVRRDRCRQVAGYALLVSFQDMIAALWSCSQLQNDVGWRAVWLRKAVVGCGPQQGRQVEMHNGKWE